MKIKPVRKKWIGLGKWKMGRYLGIDGRYFGFYIRLGRVLIELA